jgi:hypothetical protein
MRNPLRGRAALTVVALVASSVAALPLGGQAPAGGSLADADRFDGKLASIVQRAASGGGAPLRTTITENELNAYLIHRARAQMAVGIVDPSIRIPGGGRLACRAVVDLDAVRQSQARSMFDPMRFLSGKVPVSASGTLQTRGGLGVIRLEDARLSGLPVPQIVLQELVTYYSKSPLYPDGITLDSSFVLPAGIREIEVGVGQAVIVQ